MFLVTSHLHSRVTTSQTHRTDSSDTLHISGFSEPKHNFSSCGCDCVKSHWPPRTAVSSWWAQSSSAAGSPPQYERRLRTPLTCAGHPYLKREKGKLSVRLCHVWPGYKPDMRIKINKNKIKKDLDSVFSDQTDQYTEPYFIWGISTIGLLINVFSIFYIIYIGCWKQGVKRRSL